ncbi:hypothetical protein PgNI_05847, partial [Pyricularia grisea]|uniref:Uncharacterized protein n=1 Tax=Pyricularia grisea TaxID=148305 RepID=A0A6P8B3P4_PYRGI
MREWPSSQKLTNPTSPPQKRRLYITKNGRSKSVKNLKIKKKPTLTAFKKRENSQLITNNPTIPNSIPSRKKLFSVLESHTKRPLFQNGLSKRSTRPHNLARTLDARSVPIRPALVPVPGVAAVSGRAPGGGRGGLRGRGQGRE